MSKVLTDVEIKTGFVAYDPKDLPETTDTEKFCDYAIEKGFSVFTSIAYDDRVEFLRKNGYEITRENLTNPDLSAKE